MSRFPRWIFAAAALALLLGSARGAKAQPCPTPGNPCGTVASVPPGQYPRIDFRAFPGVRGSQGQDSTVSRKITLEWTRNIPLEQQLLADTASGGFGGYSVWRVYTNRDTCNIELIRRFVYKDTLLWHFPDTQNVLRFVDPDSAGNLAKICRPAKDPITGQPIPGTCGRPGDSVFVILPPPPPPDGFPIYYALSYDSDSRLVQGGFERKFVPDTTNNWANCGVFGNRTSCCNLNHLALNLMSEPVYTSGPPQSNLEGITVVPNPYRGSEAWDPSGQNRIEFRGLPPVAEIRIYTASGDLLRVLNHNSSISGAATWDLKNENGLDVASGIYMYRIWSPPNGQNPVGFRYFNHFVVIR